MSDGLNRGQVIGNLGADPELRFTAAGVPVLNLRVATTESWIKDGAKQERTDWHSLRIWGKRGEALSRILQKGHRIMAEGAMRTTEYEDREGVRRWRTEIVVSNVILLTPARQGGGGAQRGPQTRAPQQRSGPPQDGPDYPTPNDDDIPF
jgi:single-strand DNA-binding protein